MKKFLPMLVFALLLCLMATAASASGWEIDTALLKSIEAEDTFPVKITSKVVNDGALKSGDVLTLEIANNTSAEITSVTILMAPHT